MANPMTQPARALPVRAAFSTADVQLSTTGDGSLVVAQYEPSKFISALIGGRFYATTGVSSTFKAPKTAIPSSNATWYLWNGEAAAGKLYAIDSITMFLASGTSAVGGTIIASVETATHAATTAYANSAITTMTSNKGTSLAVLSNNITLGGTNVWCALPTLATGNDAASATIGTCFSAQVGGGIVIQPGYGLGIDLVSGTGTSALYGITVVWDEIDTALS